MGSLAWLIHRLRPGLNILMYHRVLPDEQAAAYPLASLAIGQGAFAAQVRWLSERCEVMTVADALAPGAPPAAAARPRVCVTFDDGYEDNHRIAAPILESAGLRASFYVTAGLIGTDEILWHDRAVLAWQRLGPARAMEAVERLRPGEGSPGAGTLREYMAALKAKNPAERVQILQALDPGGKTAADPNQMPDYRLMDWKQVADLARRGHEIGSHTLSHALLPQLDGESLARELSESRMKIHRNIGQGPAGIAYPNGDYDQRTVAAAAASGYDYALTTRPGAASLRVKPGYEPDGGNRGRFSLPRRDVNPAKVTRRGVHDRLAFAAHLVGVNDLRWT